MEESVCGGRVVLRTPAGQEDLFGQADRPRLEPGAPAGLETTIQGTEMFQPVRDKDLGVPDL